MTHKHAKKLYMRGTLDISNLGTLPVDWRSMWLSSLQLNIRTLQEYHKATGKTGLLRIHCQMMHDDDIAFHHSRIRRVEKLLVERFKSCAHLTIKNSMRPQNSM